MNQLRRLCSRHVCIQDLQSLLINLGLQNLGHLIVATGLYNRVCLYRYNITAVLHLFRTVSGLAIL